MRKEECLNHIKKYMGRSNLRKAVSKYKRKKLEDGIGLSKRGKFINARINTI